MIVVICYIWIFFGIIILLYNLFKVKLILEVYVIFGLWEVFDIFCVVVVLSCIIVLFNFCICCCSDFMYFMVLFSMLEVLVCLFMLGIKFWSFFICLLIFVLCMCFVMLWGCVVYFCFVWVCIGIVWKVLFFIFGLLEFLLVECGKFMWWIKLFCWFFWYVEFLIELFEVLFLLFSFCCFLVVMMKK